MPGEPGTRWGWHQLSDPWADQLVRSAGIRRGDLVVDIGAGAGAITRPLLERGARVVAVELHPGRVADLRRRFADDPVTVVRADAADLRLPRRRFSVVANPPFAAASPVLRRLLAPGSRLTHARLVLPAPVAHRWAAGDVRGAARWWPHWTLHVEASLPRSAFRPPPRVGTVILAIERAGRAPSRPTGRSTIIGP